MNILDILTGAKKVILAITSAAFATKVKASGVILLFDVLKEFLSRL